MFMQHIQTTIGRYSSYAPVVLRIGIAFVFIWFGLNGLTHTDTWVRLVPEWALAIAPAATLVKIHGLVELVFGIFLAFGIYARVSATILLLSIVHTLTLISGSIFIRDAGLAIALVSLVLQPYRNNS
jgi:uncharacterized membrane protein YphA (DoxX/SURF4 family)